MKKLGVFLSIILLGVAAFAQSQPRPRVVTSDPYGTPTPTPRTTAPVLQGSTQNSEKRPPVLQGGRTTPQPTATPATDDVVVEDDEVIKVETNLVTMPVSVLDRDGRFIAGLQQRDFQIFENGTQQRVEYFQSVETPFTVILLIDVSPSTQFKMDEIQDAAIEFVNQLRRDDRVQVIAFDQKIHVLSPVTNDRRVLQNAIRQTSFGDGTSLYDAIDFVVERQLRGIQGRKAVVVFTDGVDTTSRRTNYQSTVRSVEEVDALIYPVRYDTQSDMNGGWSGGGSRRAPTRTGGGGWGAILGTILSGGNVRVGGGGGGRAGSSSQEYETGKRYLEEIARNSGGRNFEARNDLRAAFTGIAEELRWQYSIGYYPENVGKVGDRKQIRIRVMRPNVVVRAKTSYIVGKADRSLAGK